VISSSETLTVLISGSGAAAVSAPRISYDSTMVRNQCADAVEFLGREPSVCSKCKWLDPELAALAVAFHVHMRRLIAIETIEEESVRSGDVRNGGHQAFRFRVIKA
jgi:hypothetical protein